MTGRDRILDAARAVPALPAAATEAIALLQDPETDWKDIVKAIQHDAGLTANILRLANSAAVSGGREIHSLQEASVRLGSRRLLRLVLAASVGPAAARAIVGYDMPPGRLWEHSASVALAVECVAKACGREAPPQGFTAGLLHDIGKIALGTFVAVDVAPILEVAAHDRVPFDAAERAVLGVDHAEVGAEMLTAWGIPAAIVDPVRRHHRPDSGETTILCDLVHVADTLCLAGGLGMGRDGLQYHASSAAAKRLGLSRKASEAALLAALEAVDEARELLKPKG